MYEFASTKTIPSKVFPGIDYTIRVFSEGLRTDVHDLVADAAAATMLLEAELQAKREELGYYPEMTDQERSEHTKSVPKLEFAELSRLYDKQQHIQARDIDPHYVSVGLVSIAGIKIDGKVPDAETLRRAGPTKLYQEILESIMQEVRLKGETLANLGSPTTSGAEVDGTTPNTTASNAKSAEPTKTETAADISQTT